MTVAFTPTPFRQSKLMFELYLVPDPRLIAVVNSAADVNTACNRQIRDVVVKCDIAKVDTGAANTHAKLTQEGGTIP
eukprot:12904911-Prorocentrum_lima.AAC.1